jgi:hypothetical protein
MQPETREILQCVHASRSPQLQPQNGQPSPITLPPSERINSGFAKQSVLSAAFDNPKTIDQVIAGMKTDSPKFQIVGYSSKNIV